MQKSEKDMAPCFLVVEDDIIVARFIETTLHEMGYEKISIADSFETALASARGKRPDLALLDINLGSQKDGVDLAKELKRLSATQVIFITAYDDNATVQKALPVQPAGYLLKPFDERDLNVAVKLALSKIPVHARNQKKRSNLSGIDLEQTKAILEKLLVETKLYLKPDLNFSRIAEKIKLSDHQLSEFLNKVLGYSFYDYINHLRIEEAKRILNDDPSISILQLSKESGYNHRSTFHSAFKKKEGVSPEDYKIKLFPKGCK